MKAITGILLAGFLALFLAGCGRESSKQSWTEDNSTDQLYSETQADTEIFLFQINGRVYTVDGVYPVDRFIDEEMEDGGFYRITADVTILNGGVAGYYNFPQIDQVKECVPVSWSDLNLPAVAEKQYGLVLIGDYFDDSQKFCRVSLKDYSMAKEAVQYFIGLGHRKIGFIGGSEDYSPCKKRLKMGFLACWPSALTSSI